MSEDEEYGTIIKLWYEMYQPHIHEVVCGYNEETIGKPVVVFRNRRSGRVCHVYLHDQKLMPFFPK